MTELITTTCVTLASNIKSHALQLSDGPLRKILTEGANESKEQRTINWPHGVNKSVLLDQISSQPYLYLKSFSLDKIGHHFIYPYEHEGDLTMLTISGSEVRILVPTAPRDVFAGIAGLLLPTEAAPPLNVKYNLSPNAFTSLCAIIDLIRQLFATSLVLRQGIENILFTVSELEEQIQAGKHRNDYRWFGAMLEHLVQDQLYHSRIISNGCDQLELEGLITSHAKEGMKAFAPTQSLINVALQFVNLLPALTIDRANSPGDKGENITTILNGQCLWCVESTKQSIKFESIDGLSAVSLISAVLREQSEKNKTRQSGEKRSKTKDNKTAISTDKKDGNAKLIAKKFCTNCGEAVKQNTRFCTNCGHQLNQLAV